MSRARFAREHEAPHGEPERTPHRTRDRQVRQRRTRRARCAGGPPRAGDPRVRPGPGRRRAAAAAGVRGAAGSMTTSSTSGCAPRSPRGPAPTWTSSPPTCPPRRRTGQRASGRRAGRPAGGRWRTRTRSAAAAAGACPSVSPRWSTRATGWLDLRAAELTGPVTTVRGGGLQVADRHPGAARASGSRWTASGSARAGRRRKRRSSALPHDAPDRARPRHRLQGHDRDQHQAAGALTRPGAWAAASGRRPAQAGRPVRSPSRRQRR